MNALAVLRTLTPEQRNAFLASFLGWTLDAFDFFLVAFSYGAIAKEFGSSITLVATTTMITLAMRPLGAFLFGWLADKFGRRPILMIDILLFAGLELASAFAPSLPVFFVLRALFGIAMGGEWGIGAALTMETIPPRARGVVSGILQEGYACGFLLASLVNLAFPIIGWRGMFIAGVVPALLVIYIRAFVKESPVWEQHRAARKRTSILRLMKGHWKLALYVILLMTAFNFFSHGTQDLYPQFLRSHKFPNVVVSWIPVVMNIGAICGGILFGTWSERVGRRRAIITAVLLSLLVMPLWAFAATPLLLALGAFLMQFMVQGAWGVIPTHLNELSPPGLRSTFPGFTYQIGNLLASVNITIQAAIAESHGGNYAIPLALVAGTVALVIAGLTWAGPERKDVDFTALPE